jgi:DNA-binding transcriptional regulator GbsR (MarR family)
MNSQTLSSILSSPLSSPAPTTLASAEMPEMKEFSEQIGEFIHYWGFKRVHGRIWTHLFLAEAPLDASDLVQQLGISKALVSISLRELLEYEVIQEVGKSPEATNLYRTNPDILSVIMSVLRGREKRMLARLQDAHENLARVGAEKRKAAGISQRHLDQVSSLIGRAVNGLDALMALSAVDFGDWRKEFLTVDLQEEDDLRKRSIVAPPAPRTRAQFAQDREPESASPAARVSRVAETAEARCPADSDAIQLPSGTGKI